jgi:hypothetical protein
LALLNAACKRVSTLDPTALAWSALKVSLAMQHTAPVLLPVAFIVSRMDFPLLRWIMNAHFNLLSRAAFHPHDFRQGLSSRFLGKEQDVTNDDNFSCHSCFR